MFEYSGVKISWLGHDSFRIKDSKTIYIDPYQIRGGEPADILLVSHEHYDHCSVEDARKIVTSSTVVITTQDSKESLSALKAKEIRIVKPGDKQVVYDISIEAVPAYNVNKFRTPGKVFHPKEDQKVGFILSLKGLRIYHGGDTDLVPEMKDFKPDLALLPVSGTYVMTAQEAAEATKILKPKLAIPMHYGAIVGSERDAENFKRLASCQVEILTKET